MDIPFMKKTCKEELAAMGIDLRDVDQPIGTLSGGERQGVASGCGRSCTSGVSPSSGPAPGKSSRIRIRAPSWTGSST
jgi:hypothetical protein